MSIPRFAWNSSDEKPKPASNYDIKYGYGLIKRESLNWPTYNIITTPSAFNAARKLLATKPVGSANVRLLDWNYLDQIEHDLPNSELFVGIGGGMALDASKYIALKRGVPLIIIPSIVSSGAIIHGHVAKWERRHIVGTDFDWPWIDFDDILVDYDLVLEAPDRLNSAGLGDVLCGFASISEWKHNASTGKCPPCDNKMINRTLDHHNYIVDGFPKTLCNDQSLSDKSIKFIMSAIQDRDELSVRDPAAPSADHSLWLAIEEINSKSYIHGEIVALSAAIIAWHCGESPSVLPKWLDICQVNWRPRSAGISKIELQRALEFIPSYLSNKISINDTPSILSTDPIIGKTFNNLWNFLDEC